MPGIIANQDILASDLYHIRKLITTASEDLTAGQSVGISNIVGGVARAQRNASIVTHGITIATGAFYGTFCPIGGDKFVTIEPQTSDDSLYAIVYEIDRDTLTATAGTPSAATADFGSFRGICKLNTDKFVVFYTEDASATIIKYRVGTVSGTTITWGSAATFATGATSIQSIMADQISTDKIVMFYGAGTATDSRLIVATFSGTVATIGTPSAIGTTIDNGVQNVMVKKIGTDKFILATDSQYAQVGTCTGTTTITLGTQTQFTSVAMGGGVQLNIISPASDVCVIGFYDASQVGYVVAGTISGTTPTFGTVVTGDQNDNSLAFQSSGVFYRSNGGTETIKKYTLSGTTITSAGFVINNATGSNGDLGFLIYMDNGYLVSIVEAVSTQLQIWIEGMSNNFVGFVQSTVSRGASCEVVMGGVDSNQSGLAIGMRYKPNNTGGLTAIGEETVVDSVDDLATVRAISATEVVF